MGKWTPKAGKVDSVSTTPDFNSGRGESLLIPRDRVGWGVVYYGESVGRFDPKTEKFQGVDKRHTLVGPLPAQRKISTASWSAGGMYTDDFAARSQDWPIWRILLPPWTRYPHIDCGQLIKSNCAWGFAEVHPGKIAKDY